MYVPHLSGAVLSKLLTTYPLFVVQPRAGAATVRGHRFREPSHQ